MKLKRLSKTYVAAGLTPKPTAESRGDRAVATPTARAVRQLMVLDSLLPTQLVCPPADCWLQRLYRAILEDALECLEGRGAPSSMGMRLSRERARRRQAAWDWIMADAEYCFSFRTVCLVLDLDVGAVRSALQRRWGTG